MFCWKRAILTAKGINPIPFDESMVAEVCSYVFAGIMALWSWWKDAPMTKIGKKHHDEMVLEKQTGKGVNGENFFDAVEEAE